ncbi:FUSC family protein [Nocardia sp. NEAU-G5]|uniref:FUSC family protein n=1 Tax=Nocardia albiluteola TaxID=2842303 RepID=A0ABS6AU13_9NOCA|nr:FUSC family protein [Nocardia albiluteola]MBU3061502.1 FUSC family protein [Nocardia albiluteola]
MPPTSSPTPHLVDRSTGWLRRAGRMLSLQGVFRLRPVVDTWRRSAASGLIALGVPEVALLVTGHLQLAFFTCAGGLCALYGHGLPYAARARALAWVVFGMVAGTGVALLTAASTTSAVAKVLVLALLAGVYKLVCDASRVGPPGNIIFTFIVSAAGFLPIRLAEVPSRLLLVLCGGVLAWLVCLAPALIRPHDPERFAVARALAATARLIRLAAGAGSAAQVGSAVQTSGAARAGKTVCAKDLARARYDAAAATHAAWHTVRLVPARSVARAAELSALIRLLVRAESLATATYSSADVAGSAAPRGFRPPGGAELSRVYVPPGWEQAIPVVGTHTYGPRGLQPGVRAVRFAGGQIQCRTAIAEWAGALAQPSAHESESVASQSTGADVVDESAQSMRISRRLPVADSDSGAVESGWAGLPDECARQARSGRLESARSCGSPSPVADSDSGVVGSGWAGLPDECARQARSGWLELARSSSSLSSVSAVDSDSGAAQSDQADLLDDWARGLRSGRAVPVVDCDVAEEDELRGIAMQRAVGAPSGLRRVAGPFRPGSAGFPVAVRVAVAAAVAGLVSVLLGVDRPYWAVMTAGVLVVANTAQSWHRTVQRVVGNLVGLGLFTVLVPVTHSPVGLVAMALCCQLVVEATISRNYWVAQIFVTPMALAMVEFAGPLSTGRLAVDRWLDTCVGALVAVAICFAVPNRRAADRVAVALRELDAVGARARAALASGIADRGVRERLAAALVELRESADVAAGEWWSTEVAQDRVVASERAGHQVLAQLPVRLAAVSR